MAVKVYHCTECGADFLAPHYVKNVELHPELDGEWAEVSYEVHCPECDSEHVEDRWACEACSAHPSASGSEFCIACQMRADDALAEALQRVEQVLDVCEETAYDLLEDAIRRHYEE